MDMDKYNEYVVLVREDQKSRTDTFEKLKEHSEVIGIGKVIDLINAICENHVNLFNRVFFDNYEENMRSSAIKKYADDIQKGYYRDTFHKAICDPAIGLEDIIKLSILYQVNK